MSGLAYYKRRMFLYYWIDAALAIFPKSFNDVLKAGLTLFISLFLTAYFFDSQALLMKIEKGSVDFVSLVLVVLIYLLIHLLLTSPIKAFVDIKKIGFWDGEKFYYKQERLIFTGIIHPTDESLITIKFPPECSNCMVYTRTVVDQAHNRVKAGFTCMKNEKGWVVHMTDGISRCGIRLLGRNQVLVTKSLPNTNPVKVSIYLEHWSV